MSKQLQLIEEQRISPAGVKIGTFFVDKINSNLKKIAAENLTAIIGREVNSVDKFLEELVTMWRWWGDSYGYFHRKSDGVNWANNLLTLLKYKILSFSLPNWKLTSDVPSLHWYLDPKTLAPKQSSAPDMHPVHIGPAGFTLDLNQSLLDEVSGELDLEMLLDNLGQTIVILGDIATLMASSESAERAETINETREVHLQGLTSTWQEQLLPYLLRASAELVSIFHTNSKPCELETDNYTKYVLGKYGVRNSFSWSENVAPESITLWSDVIVKPAVVQVALAPVVEEVEIETELVPVPEVKRVETKRPNPIPEPVPVAVPISVDNLIHKVTIGGKLFIISVTTNPHPEVYVLGHRVEPGLQGMLNIMSRLINLGISRDIPISEVLGEISGDYFGPGGETSDEDIKVVNSVSDYLSQWLTKTLE